MLLSSAAGGVINGSRADQTNMDLMVAMGTASAAPQKVGRVGGREGGRRGGGGEVECEVKNKRRGRGSGGGGGGGGEAGDNGEE